MNADIVIQGFGQYDSACRELEKLLGEFKEASEGTECYWPLYHQLIWLEVPLTAQQLSAFKKANTKHDGDWQKWDEFPDRNPCGRFFGFEQGHDAFITLANRGIEILKRIAKLRDAQGVILPGDLVLDLPDTMDILLGSTCSMTPHEPTRHQFYILRMGIGAAQGKSILKRATF